MKIDFKALIQEWNEKHPDDKLTRAKLAREMVAKDYFRSEMSALNMMYYHEQGCGKSVDDLLFRFISEKFGKTYEEIVIR
jgi:FMN-dependent NADH-azoreductase